VDIGENSLTREKIYDAFRNSWVVATPEEIVRQRILQKMVQILLYPKELITVERSLVELCPEIDCIPNRRVDIVCFTKTPKGLAPLLIIECKESAQEEKRAIDQVLGYNRFLQARFVAVVHPEAEVFGYPDAQGFSFLPYLPTYRDLVKAASYG
jgi:hypothetical protein